MSVSNRIDGSQADSPSLDRRGLLSDPTFGHPMKTFFLALTALLWQAPTGSIEGGMLGAEERPPFDVG
jgi:hypothetical protein